MNNLITHMNTRTLTYAIFAVVATLVIVFAVLPVLPNTHSQDGGVSLSAQMAAAQDAGGGAGDAGGSAGGDAGGGAGDAAGGGDAGGGGAGDAGGSVGGDATGGGAGDAAGGCCGDSTGGGADNGGLTALAVTPVPVCGLTGSPAIITQGGSAILSWVTQDATSVSINQNVGIVPLSGTRSVSPTVDTTYTLTATGPGGSVTCTQTIAVVPLVQNAPACTFDAAPLTITRGFSSILSWTTQNAASVSINQNIGSVPLNSSHAVAPTVDTTYTLTVVGTNGTTATCVRTVTVLEPVIPQPLTCDAFTAAPATLTAPGNTTLTWATSNATGVTINNGVGTVPVDGSQSVFVNANTTYTLTATRGTETVTCSVPVTIVPNAVVPSCDAFTVSPSSLQTAGTVTLTWNTTNATNVSINQGIGSVAVDGTRTATVNANTTYTLTATNGTATTSCQASVAITTGGGGGGGGGGSSAPSCSLTASDTSITSGQKVTLTWKNARTNDILLKDSRGETLVDTKKDTKIHASSGTFVVNPTKSTAYTLTAIRGSQKRTCTVDINVQNVSVTSVRTRDPLVAGISLSRLPYTGFDAGPLMTGFFYFILIVWALAVAYILVLRREPVLGMSLKAPVKQPVHTIPEVSTMVRSKTLPTPTHMIAPSTLPLVDLPIRTIPRPRTIPAGSMASSDAARGYEEYYAATPIVTREPEIAFAPVAPVQETSAADLGALEARAHDAQVLISTDALHFITAQSGTEAEHFELLDMIIGAAKAQFPKEDGWVVVNKDRIISLLK